MKNWEKLKLIKDNFYTYYRMAGYDKVASSPLIPKDDQTIFFSNSAIVSFKPYLDKESPRLFNIQRCIRFRGAKDMFDLEEQDYMPYFNMMGSIASSKYWQEVAELSQDFLLNTLNIPEARLYADISSKDPELIKNFSKYFEVQVDKLPDSEYHWKFGLDKIHGRGVCFSMRYGENQESDLGQIIQINYENKPTNYAFGFGAEKFLMMYENHKHFYEATSVYDFTKDMTSSFAWRYRNSLAPLCYLYSQNVNFDNPEYSKQKKIVSSVLHKFALVTDLLAISQERIERDIKLFSLYELNGKTDIPLLLEHIDKAKKGIRHNKEFQLLQQKVNHHAR